MAIDHWAEFKRFCVEEVAAGGPDPQVGLVAAALHDMDDETASWSAGAFVVPYTCGAAAAIWGSEPYLRNEEDARLWLVEHAEGLPTRRERRVIWGTDKRKMAESLISWAEFAQRLPERRHLGYDDMYDLVQKEVRYFGRYAAMKVLEILWRRNLIDWPQTDIRPRGGKYPRLTLGLLNDVRDDPRWATANAPARIRVINRSAHEAKLIIEAELGWVTWFQFETLLCNYRQSLAGKYPGRSQDRELAHWITASAYWGSSRLESAFPFFDLREAMFGREYLGELGTPRWWGAREELEQARKEYLNEQG